MFKTTLNYKNFRDEDKTKTLRFNLTESEMTDLVEADPMFNPDFLGGLRGDPNELTPDQIRKMYTVLRKLVVYSYGEVSEDGEQFLKTPEIADAFMQSAVFDAFMDKLFNSDDTSFIQAFMLEVIPAKYRPTMKEQIDLAENK